MECIVFTFTQCDRVIHELSIKYDNSKVNTYFGTYNALFIIIRLLS